MNTLLIANVDVLILLLAADLPVSLRQRLISQTVYLVLGCLSEKSNINVRMFKNYGSCEKHLFTLVNVSRKNE